METGEQSTISVSDSRSNYNLLYYKRLRENRERQLNHLAFLIKCKKKKLIPNFLNIRCRIATSFRLKKTLKRVHFIVLRSIIKDTRAKLAYIESKLYNLHLKLTKHVHPIHWHEFDQDTYQDILTKTNKHRTIHRKKLGDLITKMHQNNAIPSLTIEQKSLMDNPKVINLSNTELTQSSADTLSLGLDFSIRKKNSDNLQIVSNIEKSFKHSRISSEQKEFLRHKIAQVLVNNNKPTPSNLTIAEMRNIKDLKMNQHIVITPADKGNNIVILSSEQYNDGIEELLATGNYSMCNKSSLEKQMKEVKEIVNHSPSLDIIKKRALIPSYYQPGRMYLSPKIHKPTLAYRPILSSINTPSYLLAKHMAKQLAHIPKLNPYSINNNKEFLSSLRQQNPEDTIMMSFDVKSMFTSIPAQAAVKALSDRLKSLCYNDNDTQAIIKIIEVCTRPPIFSVNQKLYKQDQGLPMGGSLSPLLCDVYMWSVEEKLQSLPLQPMFWKRYVDDVFALIKTTKDEVPSFLQQLNNLDPHVQFTVETEQENTLPFLDMAITRDQYSFITRVYRKPYAVTLPPHNRSAHPHSQKMSAFIFYILRAINVCSSSELVNEEITFIKHIASDRGYNPGIVDNLTNKLLGSLNHPSGESTLQRIHKDQSKTPFLILPQSNPTSTKIATICKTVCRPTYKPDMKISTFLHVPKDHPKEHDQPGVYCIPCECGQAYVGQTCRALRYRISEHKTNIKYCRTSTSNLALHAWENDHKIQFQNTRIIKKTSDYHTLNTYETANIIRNKDNLINDEHYPPFPTVWNRIAYQIAPLPLKRDDLDRNESSRQFPASGAY